MGHGIHKYRPGPISILRRVPMPYEEWLAGLIEYTEEKGTRPCEECGAPCKCLGITTAAFDDGLFLAWYCQEGHLFGQHQNEKALREWYEQKKPTKRVEEKVAMGRYGGSYFDRLRSLTT